MNDNEIMTELDADELLEQIAEYEAAIAESEAKRDAFIARYENKIAIARDICDRETSHARIEIELLTEQLKRFAQTQISDKKRSVRLPSGTLQFRKQSPEYFYDDLKRVDGKDERLIQFVKHSAHEYLKVKVDEAVDWAAFKGKLSINDDGAVYYSETGEVVDGLYGQTLPDKFVVKTS